MKVASSYYLYFRILFLLAFFSFSIACEDVQKQGAFTQNDDNSNDVFYFDDIDTSTTSTSTIDIVDEFDGGDTKLPIDDHLYFNDDSQSTDNDDDIFDGGYDNDNDVYDDPIVGDDQNDNDDDMAIDDDTDDNDDDANTNTGNYTYELYIKGDNAKKTFTDGLSGQTPNPFKLGVHKFALMESANDTSPFMLFDNGSSYKEVDLLKETKVVSGNVKDIPSGNYTHAKVKLTFVEHSIQAKGHTFVDTDVTINTLVGINSVTRNSVTVSAGQVALTGVVMNLPINLPVQNMEIVPPGVTKKVENGEVWWIVPLPSPLSVSGTGTKNYTIKLVLDVYEGFRWKDETTNPKFSAKEFDISVDVLNNFAATYEPVTYFGITNYKVDVK